MQTSGVQHQEEGSHPGGGGGGGGGVLIENTSYLQCLYMKNNYRYSIQYKCLHNIEIKFGAKFPLFEHC